MKDTESLFKYRLEQAEETLLDAKNLNTLGLLLCLIKNLFVKEKLINIIQKYCTKYLI